MLFICSIQDLKSQEFIKGDLPNTVYEHWKNRTDNYLIRNRNGKLDTVGAMGTTNIYSKTFGVKEKGDTIAWLIGDQTVSVYFYCKKENNPLKYIGSCPLFGIRNYNQYIHEIFDFKFIDFNTVYQTYNENFYKGMLYCQQSNSDTEIDIKFLREDRKIYVFDINKGLRVYIHERFDDWEEYYPIELDGRTIKFRKEIEYNQRKEVIWERAKEVLKHKDD